MHRRPSLALAPLMACNVDERTPDLASAGDRPGTAAETGALLPGAAPAASTPLPEPGAAASPGESGSAMSCLATAEDAVPSPLDLLLQLDSSASMLDVSERASPRVSKWEAVRQAVQEFATLPDNGELGVGLSYFPSLVSGVPDQCTSNAECGVGGPCSNSICVEPYQLTLPGTAPSSWWRVAPAASSNCRSDAECPVGASCRAMSGQCTLPGGFVNLSLDAAQPSILAVCATAEDCPGASCEGLGLCDSALTICTAVNAACASGAACTPIAFSCLGQTSCNVADYELPAVPIAALGSNAAALLDSLAARVPEGITPSGPALEGALRHGALWARQHPERQVAVLFATDGLPTSCAPVTLSELSTLTASARAAAQAPLELHVAGIFNVADLAVLDRTGLDELARAGGTTAAHLSDTAGDVPRSFLNTLRQIRDEAASCGVALPALAQQRSEQLTLELTQPTGETTPFHRVGGPEACEPRGWYYVRDGVGAPARLQVCAGSCPAPFGPARLRMRFACEPNSAG